MAHKIKIIDAGRFESLPDNATVIDVTYNVVEENEKGEETILAEYRESFSLKNTKEDIEKHLARKLKTFKLEQAHAEKQKEIDKTFETADATIESLKDVVVEDEETKEKRGDKLKDKDEVK